MLYARAADLAGQRPTVRPLPPRVRRAAGVGSMALAALVVLPPVAPAAAAPSHHGRAAPKSEAALAADAFVWGYPLVVTERTLQSLARLTPVNQLTFQATRSDVTTRSVVAPNTDRAAPNHTPNRKPPAGVITTAMGSEKATTSA